jgi:DNA-binding transcriptional LysR family regulator
MIPGMVPVALLVARTDTHAVLIDNLLVYPTGFDFDLAVRRRPGRPRDHRHRWHLWDDELRLEVRFADGQTASTHPRSWPRTFETEPPDPPFLYYHGGGGSERGWHSGHWLWGLPPPGPLTFVCQWPANQLATSEVEIDASLVLDAADRAVPVWPMG